MSIKHPMRPVGVGYTPGPPENQCRPEVGQDDLFEALEVKLGHIDLIRNILPMQWNMEVQPPSIIPWGWPYKSISELGHADLFRDLPVKIKK